MTTGRSPSTHEEVAADALLLTRELIAEEIFVDKKGGCGGRINHKGRPPLKGKFITGGQRFVNFFVISFGSHNSSRGSLLP